MLRSKKNKSILSTLFDRELNNKCEPYLLTLSVISQLYRSNKISLFDNYWKSKRFPRPVAYDSGYIYFADYTECCAVNGINGKPSPVFKMERTNAKLKVSDVISYSVPTYKTIDHICKCGLQVCTCLSQFLLTISEDNWLCQHVMSSGKLLRQYYVNRIGRKFRFKYCDWDIYGDRFVITSTLNPDLPKGIAVMKSNVVVNLAVFTAFPFEFLALLEIKRSVFGENCTAANMSDHDLILGLGSCQVHIYSFEAFLAGGELTRYKLGEKYGFDGKVGFYPTGLPLNFDYSEAPPLLFDVQCHGQIIRFGGYPYHYITAAVRNSNHFKVTSIETNIPAIGCPLITNAFETGGDCLLFHPDHSNRLIFKTEHTVECYRLSSVNGSNAIRKVFSMGFFTKEAERPTTSSFGRPISCRSMVDSACTNSVYCTDYLSDLDLFIVMGVYCDNPSDGFVKMYDSETGEEMRTVQLREKIVDNHFYQLYVEVGSITLIERTSPYGFIMHVYNMR